MLNTKKIYGAMFILAVVCWLLGFSMGRYLPNNIELSQEAVIENSYVVTDNLFPMLSDIYDYSLEMNSEPDIFFPLSADERWVAECLVEGESGNQSWFGRLLVAQCIFDACVQDGLLPSEVKTEYGYQGWSENVSEITKDVVDAVFNRGEMAVEANILWFYNPNHSEGQFHETQQHIITEGGHKFFAPWN